MKKAKILLHTLLAVDFTAQLAIFIHKVDSNLCVIEEIMDVKLMHGGMTE